MHEISHILLGHSTIQLHDSQVFEKKPEYETAADMLAIRILAPACVLWALNAKTPEEIMKWCKIPHRRAKQRADRMKELYKRDAFFRSKKEQAVFRQFIPFLLENGCNDKIIEFESRISK